MADPISIAAIGGLTISAVTAGVSMFGSAAGAATKAMAANYEGQAEGQMYDYRASVARVNQQIDKQNADYELAVGEVNAQRQGMKTRFEVGETKAVQAASGLDVNKGSAVMVRESEIAVGAQDQAIIRASAAKKAFGYEVKAFNENTQASLYDMAGNKSRVAGKFGVASSLIGGATSVADKWYQYNSAFGKTPDTTDTPEVTK